jgi:histidinol-phosphate aminotransferase
VLRVIDLRGRLAAGERLDYAAIVPRADFDVAAAVEQVRPICDDVAAGGASALRRWSQRFDAVVPESFRVPVTVLQQAADELPADVRAAFTESIRRRRVVAEAELGETETTVDLGPGATVTQRMVPVDRVGLYVPGGVAPLASSVIMNVVPAQVAGVGSIAVSSPPQPEFGGLPHPSILGLCALLGVEEVYAVGGAQAIAMFAYGVPDLCPPVNLITGPGNIYVTAAKRLLKGRVNIDSEAGPTEIAIVADHSADPAFVAADLISQAEHGASSAALLISADTDVVDRTQIELKSRVPQMRHHSRIETALTGTQSAAVLVDDLSQAVAVANAYAAEHLEIHTEEPQRTAAAIRNAGAIFLGPYSPVSLGDYSAGSTHVLPTAGCACHSSGLNAKSFLKAVHIVDYSDAALAEVGPHVEVFAEAEDLPAHGAAVAVRRSAHRDPLEDSRRRLPVRPELLGQQPYGAPQLDVPVRLNVNENPYPPSERVRTAIAAAVAEAAGSMNRYPDREAQALRTDLARYLRHGLTAKQVWAANGSNEVLTQVLQAFGGPGRTLLSFTPTYSMYPEYARNTHTRYVTAARRDDFGLDIDRAVAAVEASRPDVVVVASPNNPTGTAVGLDVITAICEAADGVVVVDEAYQEFARTGTPSALELLPEHPRLAVSRTMSKAFAFAGGRLGYLAAGADFVDALRIVRLPYHLSAVTQAVARVALAHAAEMLAAVDALRAERDQLAVWLRGVGLEVADSDANFVLFGRFPDRHQIWQGLLDRGVLIRETGPDGWLRVSAGTPEEMAAFRGALTEVLGLKEAAR